MRAISILEEAVEDIENARGFYNDQASGIGDYFADAIVSDIASLALYHGIHARHFGFYRMLADRFPFGIYYRDLKMETQVFAVLDLRRDPNWIRKELSERI